jgi:iron complex outermembrane receptor protein
MNETRKIHIRRSVHSGAAIVSTLFAAAGISGTVFPRSAVAQETSGPEEIVVSARRREERIEDVPISVAAFSAESLADRQITNTARLSEIAPNVQFSPVAPSSGNSASSAIFIRGVGQTDFIASTDPGVGFYVDGLYFARASGTAVALLDVDRIEVLRGPQGTLFGRNTIGGAIQVISKKPTLDKLEGNVSATVGRYSRQEVTGALNLPLADSFALRFAGTFRQKDGYVTNVLNGRDLGDVDTYAGRVSAFWKPSDSFDVLWVNDYMSEDTNGSATVFGGINTAAPFVRQAAANAGCPGFTFPPTPAARVPENTDPRCPNNQWLALGPYKVASEAPTRSKLEMYGSALTATWNAADWLTLKSITGYRRTKPYSLRDADNTPQLILETINQDDVEQFTQELQFLGDAFDDRLHWQAGAYYFRETDSQFYPVYLPSRISPTTGEELQNGGLNSASDIKNSSYAFFTQETFDITKELNLTVGVRYTNDTKEATPHMYPSPSEVGFTNVGYNAPNPAPFTGTFTCLGPVRTTPGVVCTGATDTMFAQVLNKREDSKLTPMASLQYRWSPDLMTYVSYSKGFKSGGFNTRIIQPVVGPNAPTGREFLPAFDPEEVTAYELGAKTQLGGIARLSAAVFRSEYKDIQIVVREGVAPVVRNAGEATIDGFELEGAISPIAGLDINLGVGYTNFEYDSLGAALNASQAALAPGALGRVDLDDQQAYTPEWSGNLGVAYRIATGIGFFTPRVDGSYRSKTYFDAANTEQIAQEGYEIYNASLRYTDNAERFNITAGLTNFTDEEYRVSGNSSLTAASGYAEVVYAPPRQWFLEASYAF